MNWGPTDFKSAALKHEPWWNGGAGSKKKEENEDLPSTKPSHIYLNGSFCFSVASIRRVRREDLDDFAHFLL